MDTNQTQIHAFLTTRKTELLEGVRTAINRDHNHDAAVSLAIELVAVERVLQILEAQ